MAAKSKQPFSGLSSEIRSILTRSEDYSSETDDDVGVISDNENAVPVERQATKKRKQQMISPSTISDIQKKTRVVDDDTNRNHDIDKPQRANAETNDEAKHIVYVRGEFIRLTARNPFTIKRDIEKTFGAVSRIECRGASLKITCVSEQQKQRALRSTQLGNVVIITSLPNSERRKQQEATQMRHQRVVITGVPTDIEASEIIEETGAIEVRRIYKRSSSGEKELTTATVLSFSCSIEEIPSRVQIGYLTFKTKTYIPLVTRCYKCQKYGHISSNCRKEQNTCPACAGPHSYEECQTRDSKKCANCGGAHSASFRECPKYVIAKQVTHRAATNHMSYRDALIQIRQEQRTHDGRRVTEQQAQESTGTSQPPSISRQETNAVLTRSTSSEQRSTSTSRYVSTSAEARSTESHSTSTSESMFAAESGSAEARSTSTPSATKVTSTECISDKDLYQLLAMIVKLSEIQVSKSSFIYSIVDYVSNKLNQSSEAVNQNIQYYATKSPLPIPPKAQTLTGSDRYSSSNSTESS